MVIRSYTAESVARALKQVRTEMGGDAVVLKTRAFTDGGGQKQYEVTACLDKATVAQANAVLQGKRMRVTAYVPSAVESRVDLSEVTPESVIDQVPAIDLPTNRLDTIERKLELLLAASQLEHVGLPTDYKPTVEAIKALRAADVPENCITKLFNAIKNDEASANPDQATIRRYLVEQLEAVIDTSVEFKPGDRVLVAGPSGSGKTSIIGRLAAELVFTRGLKVKLVSLDNFKVGAMDEIASYADLLGVDEVGTVDETATEPVHQDADKVVLIDTCALPIDQTRIDQLKAKINQLNPTHRLAVFSTLTRSSDVVALVDKMAWLKPTHLVFTMTDLTKCQGSFLAATSAADLKIAMITNSPSGADASQKPDATVIASSILGSEASCE